MTDANQQGRIRLKRTIPVANGLGECILWDDRNALIYWTDVPGKRLYRYDPVSEALDHSDVDEDLCSFCFVEDSDELLCAFRSGFAMMNRDGSERRWLHRIDHSDQLRLNDGRVDRQGRFWCGSLVNDVEAARSAGLSGKLYRVAAGGSISQHLDGIEISNGLSWSPDGATMYFADTGKRELYAFDFDTGNGTLDKKRVFATTCAPCGPDGSTVDADGFQWNAEWGRGRVVRYATDGSIDLVLELPVSHVTCVAFGGAELGDLYVTTATYGLSSRQRKAEPEAGNVFVYETPFRGLTESRFQSRIAPAGR